MHEAELFIVNPTELSDGEKHAYHRRYLKARDIEGERDVAQTYHGSGDLIRLIQEQVVGVGAIIRIWDTDLAEYHVISRRGLIPVHHPSMVIDKTKIILPPYGRLDTDFFGHPYPWNIEDHEFYSDAEIDKILDS